MHAKLKARISVDEADVERFSRIAGEWWNERGPFAPLHRLNPTRIGYIRDQAVAHFGKPAAAENGFAPLAGLSVLDVGCGGGLLSEPMARLGGDVTGIDASAENVAVAEAHATEIGLCGPEAGTKLHYRAMTAEALVEEGRTFDLVLALEIVEHVADVAHFLGSLTQLVKPGGLLILSTLNRTAKSFLLAKLGAEYLLRWVPIGTHDWNQFLRPSELAAPLGARGFEIVQLRGMVYHPLKREWRIDPHDLEVNYLAVFAHPADA